MCSVIRRARADTQRRHPLRPVGVQCLVRDVNRRTGNASLERHRPCLGERHPVLGAVLGHITDLETIVGRRVKVSTLGAGDGFETTTGTLAPCAAVPPGAIVVAFSTLLDTDFALALIDLCKSGHVVVAVDVLESAPFEAELDPLIARLWCRDQVADGFALSDLLVCGCRTHDCHRLVSVRASIALVTHIYAGRPRAAWPVLTSQVE